MKAVFVLIDHPNLDYLLLPVIEELLRRNDIHVMVCVCNAGNAELLESRKIPYITDTKKFADFVARLRTELPAFQLTQKSRPTKIQGLSAASLKLKNAKVAERQIQGAVTELHHLCPVEVENEYCKAASDGTVISLWTVDQNQNIFIGADALGERGKRAEAVADDACDDFIKFLNSNAVIDIYLADQLVLYTALAEGHSTLITERITEHLLTNIWVIEQFLPVEFHVGEETGKIEVIGLGV